MIEFITSDKKKYYLCVDKDGYYFSTDKFQSHLITLGCGQHCEEESGLPVLKSRKNKIIGRLR